MQNEDWNEKHHMALESRRASHFKTKSVFRFALAAYRHFGTSVLLAVYSSSVKGVEQGSGTVLTSCFLYPKFIRAKEEIVLNPSKNVHPA